MTTISGCSRCPLLHIDPEWGDADCEHPDKPDKNDEDTLPFKNAHRLKEGWTPCWCPLRKEPLILNLHGTSTA